MLGACDLVRLAAHGRLDPVAPSDSSIVLGTPPAEALHAAQNTVRTLSGAELSARYVELGGDAGATASTRRRGAPAGETAPELPLDPEFVDDLADGEEAADLSGGLARIWAPFVVIGV